MFGCFYCILFEMRCVHCAIEPKQVIQTCALISSMCAFRKIVRSKLTLKLTIATIYYPPATLCQLCMLRYQVILLLIALFHHPSLKLESYIQFRIVTFFQSNNCYL